jgi:hypothetical protein
MRSTFSAGFCWKQPATKQKHKSPCQLKKNFLEWKKTKVLPMKHLKTFFFNFLIVFFANHILPGIEVVNQTKLPHIGGDLSFALGLGFLNCLIYPLLLLTGRARCIPHIALAALALNFISYAILKILPLGIHIESVKGYFITALMVSIGSFITNFLQMKAHLAAHPPTPTSNLPQS